MGINSVAGGRAFRYGMDTDGAASSGARVGKVTGPYRGDRGQSGANQGIAGQCRVVEEGGQNVGQTHVNKTAYTSQSSSDSSREKKGRKKTLSKEIII